MSQNLNELPELKPCPFCGKAPDWAANVGINVHCVNADCGNYVKMMHVQDWNHRSESREGIGGRVAWMIERTSTLWGTEWFCAGTARWTRDPNKTIQFPDEASAKEVWLRFIGEDESKEFPYEDPSIEWVYTINITEHKWLTETVK